MTYSIRRSARAKKIKLIVKTDGKVELVLPKFAPLFIGKAFAKLHEEWIKKQHKKAKNKLPEIPSEDGAFLPFLGQNYRLNLQKTPKNKVKVGNKKIIVQYKKKPDIKKNIEHFYITSFQRTVYQLR